MNDQEKYLFDLHGYLVVKNALTQDQVANLTERFETGHDSGERRIYGSDRTRFRNDGDAAWSASSLLEHGGSFIDLIDADGNSLRTIELDEYGYAMITLSDDDRFAFVTNIFTGVMSKVDLESDEIVGQIDTGLAVPSRSLAGVAVYPG